MKRITLIRVFALAAALYPAGMVAHAQHGPGGVGNTGGLGGPHGNVPETHGNSTASGGKGHDTTTNGPSTNPGDVLDHNKNLASKLENMLHLSGPTALTTLKADAANFKNFGQFVAAVHASQNLGVPLSDFEVLMAGPHGISLGKAISTIKPDADAKGEAKKATTEADADLKD
jgi:hypothetical protein